MLLPLYGSTPTSSDAWHAVLHTAPASQHSGVWGCAAAIAAAKRVSKPPFSKNARRVGRLPLRFRIRADRAILERKPHVWRNDDAAQWVTSRPGAVCR